MLTWRHCTREAFDCATYLINIDAWDNPRFCKARVKTGGIGGGSTTACNCLFLRLLEACCVVTDRHEWHHGQGACLHPSKGCPGRGCLGRAPRHSRETASMVMCINTSFPSHSGLLLSPLFICLINNLQIFTPFLVSLASLSAEAKQHACQACGSRRPRAAAAACPGRPSDGSSRVRPYQHLGEDPR